MKDIISNYKRTMYPPYSRRDYPIIGLTLFILLAATIFISTLPNNFKSKQTDESHAQSSNETQVQSVPDEILLRFKPGVRKNVSDNILNSQGVTIKDEIKQIDVKVLKVPPQARDHVIEALSHNPAVDFAETNDIVKPQAIPNDANYSYEWHLQKIQAPTAWDSAKATGVLIGICDTGVNPVADLTPIIRTDLAWNAVDGTNSNWSDVYGHGTQVAGAAAAAANNSIGVAGVAWGAQLIPIRVSNTPDGGATVSDMSKCITYAADHGAKAINLSFEVAGSSIIDTAAQYALGKGALTTVAAGNGGTNPNVPNYPNFLAVSGTDSLDGIAPWSNYGSLVDISAPGAGIWTTQPDGTYWTSSGTSFASPITAGVVALIYGAKPTLSPSQIQNILFSSADKVGSYSYDSTGWNMYYGHGRINAANAVSQALGGITQTPPDTIAPTVNISSPVASSTVSGGINVNIDSSDNVGVTKVDLYVDGSLFATDNTSPYSFFLDTTTLSNTIHTLVAKSYDAAGNVGTSGTVSITVNNVGPTATPFPTLTPTPILPTSIPTNTPNLFGRLSEANRATSSTRKVAPIARISLRLYGGLIAFL